MTRLVGAKLYPGKQERSLAIKESGQGAEINFTSLTVPGAVLADTFFLTERP
jgi:hypothetical protein